MKIGDYVRTKDGIEKIICIEENFMDDNVTFYATDNDIWRSAYNRKYNGFTSRSNVIIKSSPNIIDLIEVGDYVNGLKIISMEKLENEDIYVGFENKTYYQYVKSWNYESRINDYKIKSIVTKEQFESMEYKVGDKENE